MKPHLPTPSVQHYFILFIIFFALTLQSCRKNGPVQPPDTPVEIHDTISISFAAATLTSITVHIANTAYNPTSKIVVYRQFNGTTVSIAEYPVTQKDTTLFDDNKSTGLITDTVYYYFAVRFDSLNIRRDSSNTIQTHTLGVTTHNYTWQHITLGEWPSYLYDVWGSSENDVWAVGSITIENKHFGLLHFDGATLTMDSTVGGLSIFGFSSQDIWIVGGAVFHFDGIKWRQLDSKTVNNQSIPLDTALFDNRPYSSMWGTSSNNIYFTSKRGTIVHWDGAKAHLESIPSIIALQDIYGTDANNIYAVGWSSTQNVILRYSYGVWRQEVNVLPVSYFQPYSVYPLNSYEINAAGGGLAKKDKNSWQLISLPANTYLNCIRGSSANNIFTVGSFNYIVHYNGREWHEFMELYNSTGSLRGIFCTAKKVFIVGNTDTQAQILIGTKY